MAHATEPVTGTTEELDPAPAIRVAAEESTQHCDDKPAAIRPIYESIRQVDPTTYLIGAHLLLHLHTHRPTSDAFWPTGPDTFYALSPAPYPPPPSSTLPTSAPITLVHTAGRRSAVFSLGEAFVKVKVPDAGATREHVTLAWLRERAGELGFVVPEVHHHAEHEGRYYLFMGKIEGETLDAVWPELDNKAKDCYASRVAGICKKLAEWKGNTISGVDGNHLPEEYLTSAEDSENFCPEVLMENCKALGMGSPDLVFYHCDLGPGNIIVTGVNEPLGVIDWETAGFVPKGWVQTKFRLSSGMDLCGDDPRDWRNRVSMKLEKEGYPEIGQRYMEWVSLKD